MMSDAQQVRRAVERFQRGRRWEHSAFPTSSGGLLHTPYPRTNAGQARTAGGGGDITIGQAPIGEIVRAEVTGHLSPGGEPVVWSNVVHRLGFASATFPNVELRLPHTAVYGIEGDFSWTDGFVFGGRVSLRLNGVGIPGLSPIRAGDVVDNAVGRTFTLAQEFVAREGDRLMVVVDHAGDAHHDLHGVIEVATKEPLRVRVIGDGPEAGPAYAAGSDEALGSSTLSISPSGVQVGDTLVAAVTLRRSGGTGTLPTGPSGWNVVSWANNPGAGYQRSYWEKPSADAGDVSGPLEWTRDGITAIAGVVFGVTGPVVRHDFVTSDQSSMATRTYQGYSPPAVPATVVNLLTHFNELVSADGNGVTTEYTGPGQFTWAAAATGSWQTAAPSDAPGGQATQAAASSFQSTRFIYVAP